MSVEVEQRLAVIYPEYVNSTLIVETLELAELYRPKSLPNEKQHLAVAYYAAHLFAKREEKIIPDGVVSEREGDLSRSYDRNQTKSAEFLKKFQELEAASRVGSITVGLNYGGC